VIRAEGVSRAVGADRRFILQPTDFAIAPGERHLILGANGSGKTTLMRVLSGLAAPTEGRLVVDGVVHGTGAGAGPGAASPSPSPGGDPASLWPRVAILFEEPDPQFLSDTVEGEVSFGLDSLSLTEDEYRRRTVETLEEYGLAELATHDPRELSAGEKARVLLAAMMSARPGALLLDQSLAHLDPGSRRMLESRLDAAARSGGLTVVRTHQDADPPFPGEHVHLMEDGRLRRADSLTAADVLAADRVPLPLALRVSATLAARGEWSGPLASDASALIGRIGGNFAAAHGAAPRVGSQAPADGKPQAGGAREVAIAWRGVSWAGRRGGRVAVESIDLEAHRGEILALVGASGSGKSTLLQLGAGIRQPTVGSVWRGRAEGHAADVLLALEYPERQLFARSVEEDVAAMLWIDGIPGEERTRRAGLALRAVGLAPDQFATRVPSTLSEGEKRRAALAAFLIEPPLALLLDEPTAGLDPEGRRALRRALQGLRGGGGAVVLASHDLDFVSAVADRVVVLGRVGDAPGAVLGSGRPEDVFRDTALLDRAGLPAPDFMAIVGALGARAVPADGGSIRDAESLLAALAVPRQPLTRSVASG
jgi:energy-coupling factor transport system ATP-binding protein